MDRLKYYAITHADHAVCNPTSPERIAGLVERMDLPRGGVVWEAACGKGELLVQLAERNAVHGVGVDVSPFEIAAARERASRRAPDADLVFVEGDAAAHEPPPGEADLAACLGASWIWGGLDGTLAALARAVRPGGLVLVGEPCWRRSPDERYLEAVSIGRHEVSDHAGNVAAAAARGLELLRSVASTEAEWDRYELLQAEAAERFARMHPDDADVPELLEEARRGRDAYLRWGRDTLGWAMYLLRTPR